MIQLRVNLCVYSCIQEFLNLLNFSTHFFFLMYDVLYVIKKQKYKGTILKFVFGSNNECKIKTDPCIFYYSMAKKKHGAFDTSF